MPSIHAQLDTRVAAIVGAAGYTVSANGTATVTGTLSDPQLEELHKVAQLCNYDCKLVAGVLTLQRR